MPKKVEKYKQFVENLGIDRRFKFEEKVIDPILTLIRENQEYLTQPENLPQLAKLGWMYNTLWYSGRVCWGYDGLLIDPSIIKALKTADDGDMDEDDENYPYRLVSCEDNPKYKIEACEPQNDEIENLIYDAWGMHVSNNLNTPTYEDFVKKLKEGRELSDLDKKMLKTNKTIDEWVEILTDKRYKYSSIYPNRRSVLNHLLCTIGNGYGLSKDGFVYSEASGADQDEASYGDWENSKFRSDIDKEVNRLLQFPELKATLNTANKYETDIKKKSEEEEKSKWGKFADILGKGDEEIEKLLSKIRGSRETREKETYRSYYPISSSSIIFKIADKEAQKREGIRKIDQSYIDAAIEICKDILAHKDEESKESHSKNVKMAEEILGKLGVEGFTFKGPEFDKYELLEDIRDVFSDFTDEFDGTEIKTRTRTDYNSWNLYLDDTAVSSYGSNNYFLNVQFSKTNSLPKGSSKSIDFLKSTPFYTGLKHSMQRLKGLKDIKLVTFGYDNVPNDSIYSFLVQMIVNPNSVKSEKEEEQSDQEFINQGFEVGNSYIILPVGDMKITARKPKTLGSSHPMNKSGKEYFSNALQMTIYNNDFTKKLVDFQIDERGFNSCSSQQVNDKKVNEWVLSEHEAMKKSDPGYGYGKREGSKYLYVHDFMLWLKENLNNLK
jgi:hypothetical protein